MERLPSERQETKREEPIDEEIKIRYIPAEEIHAEPRYESIFPDLLGTVGKFLQRLSSVRSGA